MHRGVYPDHHDRTALHEHAKDAGTWTSEKPRTAHRDQPERRTYRRSVRPVLRIVIVKNCPAVQVQDTTGVDDELVNSQLRLGAEPDLRRGPQKQAKRGIDAGANRIPDEHGRVRRQGMLRRNSARETVATRCFYFSRPDRGG